MLQKLNERTQGIFAWVVISLIAFTFALFGVEYYMQSRHENLAKADVNGEAITLQEFDRAYRRSSQATNESQELSNTAELQRKNSILEQLILKTLTTQSAIANGFNVTMPQVITAIQTIPQFQEEGHFSTNRYQQAIRNALFSPPDFQHQIKQDILLNQQRFAFTGSEFVLSNEVEQFVKLYMQTRNYEYLIIPHKQFIKSTSIEPKLINEYYQIHHQEFKTPEKISLDYIRLSMQDIRARIQISDKVLKGYYDENKNNDHKNTKSFESVKEELKNQILLEQSQTEYSRALEQLSDLAYQTPDTLEPVAAALKVSIQHSELFSHEGGTTDLTKNKNVIAAAFGREVLELGNNSEPLQLGNDAVVVIRLRDHVAADEQPLEQVKSKIESILATQQSILEAKKVGEQIISLRVDESAYSKYLQDKNLSWSTATSVKRDVNNLADSINKLAFSLGHSGDMASKALENGDFAIVKLSKIIDGRLGDLNKKQIASITQQLQSTKAIMDYELFVSGLLNKAEIIKY